MSGETKGKPTQGLLQPWTRVSRGLESLPIALYYSHPMATLDTEDIGQSGQCRKQKAAK